ncbi:hypothetical protein Micbo1qcDRAFT_177101 [Microdochium bolleyi]|uniref:Jacalin-type lectin domain-containing protein n=1 Tax=Microdochium bolleyi TaxID=196109 RepID=A0A136IYT1_9PEZI|nr:hypothetical protein Micbo1qcDRAFT_177101 [Microdochium bolleyi]
MVSEFIVGTGTVGGDNGRIFSETRFDGNENRSLVKYLEVWTTKDCLAGILVEYTDGYRARNGNLWGEMKSITLAPGETITSLGLYDNGNKTRCGGLRLTTSRNQTLSHTAGSNFKEHSQTCHSGLMAGIYGKADVDIDRLGFYFLKDIANLSITIEDKDWIDSPVGTDKSISSATLAVAEYGNSGPADTTYSFSGEKTITNSRTFTQSSTSTWGLNVQISASIFEIGIKGEASWSLSKMTSNATTFTESSTVGTTISGTLKPGIAIKCATLCEFGALDIKYKSHVVVAFKDGQRLEFTEPGVFKNALYANARTVVSRVNEAKGEAEESR